MSEQERLWKTLSSRVVLDTPFIKVRSEQVSLPTGHTLDAYYIVEERNWVGIVPFTEDGRFLLNKQYKHGIGREVLEFPAGGIETFDLDPLQAAHRELMEETGYSVGPENIELLARLIFSPTNEETWVSWYVARNVRQTGAQQDNPFEVIENILVTPAELLRLIHSGAFNVESQIAAAYMALERLGLLKVAL